MEDVRKIIVFRIGLESLGLEICDVKKVVQNTDRLHISDSYLNMADTATDYGDVPIYNIYQYLSIAPLPLPSSRTLYIILDLGNSFAAIPV